MPRFSIIIPVYNVQQYLPHCLDSVLAQTCPDWEAVCVNDGSTDGSLAILNEYASKDKRFRIIDQPNGGLSAARNAGIRAAKGEYVFFLDSDDWIVPDALEHLSRNVHGQDMLCFAGRKFIEAEQAYHQPDVLPEATYFSGMAYYNANALVPRDFPFVCAVLRIYRRAFLIKNQLGFQEGIYHEDNLFTPMACYHAAEVSVIPDCLYIYRIRPQSIMTTDTPKRKEDMIRVANILAAFFTKAQGIDRTTVYRAITHTYQVALLHDPSRAAVSALDWHLYYAVSRTKLRHRFNYFMNKIKCKE